MVKKTLGKYNQSQQGIYQSQQGIYIIYQSQQGQPQPNTNPWCDLVTPSHHPAVSHLRFSRWKVPSTNLAPQDLAPIWTPPAIKECTNRKCTNISKVLVVRNQNT